MTLLRRNRGTGLGVLITLATLVVGLAGCEAPVTVQRERGVEAYQFEQFDKAEAHFDRILDRRPADWTANYYKGLLELRDGRAANARTHLEVAYNLRPDGPPSHPETSRTADALAEALYQQGDRRRLIHFLDEVIDNLGQPEDYLRKAEYLQRLGDPDSALVAYRTALKVYPRRAEVYIAFADFYDAIDDREQAVIQLRRAYALEPQNEAVRRRLRAHGVVPGPTIGLPPESDAAD